MGVSMRRAKWLGLPVLAAALSGCLWVGCLNRVWDATTFRIKEGMTTDEVRAIAGSPNDTENDGTLWAYWTVEDGPTAPLNPVYVKFDAEGRVVAVWK
jgi:outer membrane protein assembly factor BamE (lipoprotein component of BamABCDE complex)